MNIRIRVALFATLSSLALAALAVPAAQANVLSLLPGSCGNQSESQPFTRWGDTNEYMLVPGGDFEAGSAPWWSSGEAALADGNETFQVHGSGDSRSLSLPGDSSATSLPSCTSILHPTVRLFVRNTGAAGSRLTVQALYPGLLGGVQVATLGQLSASSSWTPSAAMPLLVGNLLATLSTRQTVIAFRFIADGNGGDWSIDDVYLDPFGRG